MATSPAGSGPVESGRFLMRQLRTGSTPTRGVAPAPAGAKAVSESAGIDLDGDHPAASSQSVVGAAPSSEPVGIPDARAGARARPRFPGLALSKKEEDQEDEPTGPVTIEKTGRFGRLVDHEDGPGARQAKMNMAAVKALTPLVAAISFSPGSSAEAPMKSKALATMIVKVKKAASDVVIAMGPSIGNVDWAQGQIMQLMANAAAKQWEERGKIDLEPIALQMISLLQEPTAELQSVLDAYANPDAYIEATGPDVARARISISVTGAAWEIFDWVTRDSLTLKDQPSRVFSYDRPVDKVVELLLGRVIDEARSMQIIVNSTDIQVAHLQGSIRRIAQLAGAEYVTQTRAIMKWIDAPEIDAVERERRYKAAVERFESDVVGKIMEWVHVNFAGIEHKARKLMENFDHVNQAQDGKNRPAP